MRKEFVGGEVHLRGLIEFSNICKNNCLYCGLRRDNRNLKRYRMSPEEIVALATRAVREYGFKTIVMQSGEDLWFTPERLKPILTEIKKLDVAVTLSIGEKPLRNMPHTGKPAPTVILSALKLPTKTFIIVWIRA